MIMNYSKMVPNVVVLLVLSVATASVIPEPLHPGTPAAASVIPEPLHPGTRAAVECHLSDGRRLSDGANFTLIESGPCVYYQCQNGSVLPLDYGCYRNGVCYPLHSTFTLGCVQRTCQLTDGRFDYDITKEACTSHDSRSCIDIGTTYKDGCFDFRCDKVSQSAHSVAYHLAVAGVGCEYNGQCVPLNHTVNQGCRIVQCQQRFGAVGFFTISNGCEINGKCVPVGESIVDDCRTLTCSQEQLNGLTLLNIKPTKIQCKDADNVCHDSGEWFPLLVDGTDRVNCTCTITGVHFHLACPSIGFQINS